MQNAGQYVPGTAGAHPPQQFVPSEPSPNGGSTTSSLRQFRKRDVDKSHLEQQPKQESHVARVAPHNHYPHVSNDIYRYPSHQFSDYSPQAKYSDIADASQPNPISTSVIQKPKSKDYMEMCNVQQQHLNNQQQYSPDNGQYMQREPTQGYPTGFKPEMHYLPKDQHQYQQLTHHPGQPKFNPMMAQNMRKFTPTPADNPFLNKLSKIHPSMARSIISDHHLQDPQPSYSPMDQRGIYAQQNHRYYPSSLHQPNPYAHNPNYSINPSHHYPNYAAASCSYPRTTTMGPITQRYSHMERSISPARRGYPENLPMNHLPYHGMSQKMPTSHNYSPQYGGTPEYAQHYQHRRMGQESYLQPCRTAQYMQNHHQISAQEMQDLPESRISPSDSLKKFIENWAADEEPSNEINSIEGNMNLRDNLKVRDDAPPGTVYMINATDVQYFENNGIPIVTSDNGGIQLTSENYQYLLKNGVVENSGIVRIIEANKEISIDSSGNHERVVNLQIMEAPKSDCMMVNKNLRPNDGSMGPNMLPKMDDEARRVVIHQNTVINPGNCIVSERVLPGQQQLGQASMHDTVVESIGNSKQLVDKNCSPINLDQLEQNLGFSEPDPPETERDKNQDSSRPPSAADSNINNSDHTQDFTLSKINPSSDDTSQNSDDSQNRSPESKSMPIIDLFDDTRMEADNSDELKSDSHESKISKSNTIDRTFEEQSEKTQTSVSEEEGSHKNLNIGMIQKAVNNSTSEESFKNKESSMHDCPLASSVLKDSDNKSNSESTPLTSSVIVSTNAKESDVSKEGAAYSGSTNINTLGEHNTDEILNASNCKDNLVVKELPKHTEAEINKIVPENTEHEYKIKPLDQTTTSNETTLSTIERRKRIFSVDNIIHHIGNNMKRNSKDLDLFCSGETLTNFIEKEVEFSSLEQLLIFNHIKNKQSTNVSVKENVPVHNSNIHEPVEVTSKSTENEVNIVCKQQADTLESINGNERNEVEANIKLETNEVISLNEPLKETCEIEQKSVIINQALPKKEKDEESKGNDLKPISDIAKLPLLLDPDERSHTPSDYQYRNAIRVEETSVLLQIAGEFMEITVNIVNGKKVITVVPLSDSTIVDYNDNYEVSANIQNSDIVQLESSGTSIENMDVVEYANENNNENIGNENDLLKNNTSREEQGEYNSIIKEEGVNEVHLEEKNYEKTKDSFKEVEKRDAQVESLPDLDIQKSNIPADNNKDDIQKPTLNVISSESNETIVFAKNKLQDAENVVEIDTKADFSETNCHKEETENSKNTEDLEISLGNNLIESVSETIKPEIESIEVPQVDKETDIIDDSVSAKVAQSAEDLEIFKSCETSHESVTDNEIVQSSKSTEAFTVSEQTSKYVLTLVKETDTVDNCHSEEIAESDMFNISETATSANTAINSDIVESLKLSETFKIKGNSDITKTLNTSGHTEISENLVVEIASENSTTIHPGKETDNNDVDKKCTLEKDMSDPELDESQDKLLNNDESTQSIIEPKVYLTPSEPYVSNIEPNTYDESHLETEMLEYQLEDDVFISEDLAHEIIISDPVEDIGLVEVIDKSIDSSDIPLEPVTTTNEFKETAELLPTISEILENDESKQVVVELSDKAVNETVNILLENSNQGGQKNEDNKDNSFSSATTDINENQDKLKPDVLLLTQKLEKEPIIRNNKPDVQILSPTSTNIEDHIATSKENVYLQPRRKPSDDDVCESSSIPITTKAAKKLYECDLQIPAVTTSGDVSPKTSKKSIKCQHDTVSSSKKAKVLKESIRCKKNTVKRSKRINEKIKIKNEQKEMLRKLAEKRRQRIESKQSEAIKQDQDRIRIKQNKPAGENKRSHEGCIKDENSNNPNENDDEYVDFKELLRARKLKKLKKIQEIKRREVKDTRTRAEDVSKNERKDSKAGTIEKKVVKVDKSAVVSSSNIRDKRPEKSETCCNGTDNLTKKPNVKDNQTEIKKRKKSSDSKSNESTKEIISKAIKPESANATILLHKIEKEPEIIMASSTKIKSKSTSEEEAKHEVIDTKANNPIELENRMKNTKFIEAGTKAEATNIEPKIPSLSHNMEKIKEEHNNFKKVNPSSEMKSSFNDNIPSSTSNNSTFVLPMTKDINISSLNIKTHSTTTLKDPRKRSKSYSGQIMVPSVSELIEENNGAVPKKKISLADYVSRKRKSTENDSKAKSEEKTDSEKKLKFDESFQERKELSSNSCSPRGETVISKKSIKDVKTSFVIHSSDWEDSQSPVPSTKQSNDECLIHDFSGLSKNNYKRPVIDVNELTPLENLKDKKLQEYKDKVDSQLNSLNILIPKAKSQSAENNSSKIGAHRSPESSRLIKKFLNNERMTQSEMDKIREIISYKRLMQHQKNARSPSKSPSSASSSMPNQLPATSSYEVTCPPVSRSPVRCDFPYSDISSGSTYEIKNETKLEAQSREMRLHLKKVNAKRKLESNDETSSSVPLNPAEIRHKKSVDYSVINRLGKDGLPKIIFKRNRQSNISDDIQLVVELERIDNNLEKIEEKYNVTVTRKM